MEQQKKQRGRPKVVGGRDVKVYLDDESIEKAKRLGYGSVSEGIRIALREFEEEESRPAAS